MPHRPPQPRRTVVPTRSYELENGIDVHSTSFMSQFLTRNTEQTMPAHTQPPPRNEYAPVQSPLRQQSRTLAARAGASSATATEFSRLDRDVKELRADFDKQASFFKEFGQSTFMVIGTCMVERVPFYAELPKTKKDLEAHEGYINEGDKVTLMFPQLSTSMLLFMRVRRCDPHTMEVGNFFVPIFNEALNPNELYKLTGINSNAMQYFDWFHIPGEKDPFETENME